MRLLTSSGFACKEVICVDSSQVVCTIVSPQNHCSRYKITAFFHHVVLLVCEVCTYVLTDGQLVMSLISVKYVYISIYNFKMAIRRKEFVYKPPYAGLSNYFLSEAVYISPC